MNQDLVIGGLCIILAGICVRELYTRHAASRLTQSLERATAQRVQRELSTALCDALASLDVSKRSAAGTEDDNNKLLAGTIKACEAIATTVGELRTEVGKLNSLLTQPKPTYPEDALQQPASEEEARIVAETFAHILNGLNPEEASDRARADDEKKTMISAVNLEY